MFRFPYGNLHGLNLDWFLNEWKKFQASFTSAFTASVNTVGVNQPPDVDVTYDQNTGIYNFGFDLPEGVKPLTFQIGYTSSNSGTVIPTGVTWQDTPPYVSAGDYLWTRCLAVYNNGQNFATYSVARQGVDGQGSPATTLPLMDGTAAIGTSAAFARADHVHPSDTTRLAVSALSSASPLMDGTATAGTSSNVARADHVHPRDTSRIPTSALSTSSPLMDGVASAGLSSNVARADHVHPSDTAKADTATVNVLSADVTAIQGDIGNIYGDMAIVVNGDTSLTNVLQNQIVIVRNSTITGITDGVYIASVNVPAGTSFTQSDLTNVQYGGFNAIAGGVGFSFNDDAYLYTLKIRHFSAQLNDGVTSTLQFTEFPHDALTAFAVCEHAGFNAASTISTSTLTNGTINVHQKNTANAVMVVGVYVLGY